MLGKTEVNGDKAEPVYEWLKAQAPGLLGLKRIKWNFEKFLVGRDGVCGFFFPFWLAVPSPLRSICIIAKRFVASQGPLGEHYEAGELGGTDTRGVEGE